LRRKKSATAGDNDGFPAFSPRLRNLLLPRQVQAFGDHQVRREAGPHPVAQVLRPLHRERWRQQ
jgi:hypothetical protein